MEAIKIVLVEKSWVKEALVRLFNDAGFQVVAAVENSQALLDRLRLGSIAPDVCVLSRSAGLYTFRHIRKYCPSAKILVYDPVDGKGYSTASVGLWDIYLDKSVEVDVWIETIKKVAVN